mmetsp:Transcript_25492/g.63128  ORF Transcript_25492/g.63128 Transcript_25492/m.63128 type:complete len:230 (-) Transcript_25492:170-859(-)
MLDDVLHDLADAVQLGPIHGAADVQHAHQIHRHTLDATLLLRQLLVSGRVVRACGSSCSRRRDRTVLNGTLFAGGFLLVLVFVGLLEFDHGEDLHLSVLGQRLVLHTQLYLQRTVCAVELLVVLGLLDLVARLKLRLAAPMTCRRERRRLEPHVRHVHRVRLGPDRRAGGARSAGWAALRTARSRSGRPAATGRHHGGLACPGLILRLVRVLPTVHPRHGRSTNFSSEL